MTTKLKTYWDNKGKFQKDYDALYSRLVPASGKAETQHGELLRCVSRLYCDYFNNGFCNISSMSREISCIQEHTYRLDGISSPGIDSQTVRLFISDLDHLAELNSEKGQGIFYPIHEEDKYEYDGEFNQFFEKLIDAVILYVKEKDQEKQEEEKKNPLFPQLQKAIQALRIIGEEGGNSPDVFLTGATGPNDARDRGITLCRMRKIAVETLKELGAEIGKMATMREKESARNLNIKSLPSSKKGKKKHEHSI